MKTNTKKYRILISSCWTIDIRLFDFYRKRGLGPDQIHYNHSRVWSTTLVYLNKDWGCVIFREIDFLLKIWWSIPCLRPSWKVQTLVQITHCTSPNYTDHPEVNIHCIENFFTVHDFWATCACPENFHCIEYAFTLRIFNNLRLPWKQSFPWNFSLYWIYLLPFRIFEQLALALKNRVAQKFSLYWIYFLHSGVLSNLRMPWKTEGALNIYFLLFRIFQQLALALKNRVTLEFFTVLNILFTFRILEELALSLKNRVCPEFTVLNIYFLIFRIFQQLALALEFFKPGWAAVPPDSYAYDSICSLVI